MVLFYCILFLYIQLTVDVYSDYFEFQQSLVIPACAALQFACVWALFPWMTEQAQSGETNTERIKSEKGVGGGVVSYV